MHVDQVSQNSPNPVLWVAQKTIEGAVALKESTDGCYKTMQVAYYIFKAFEAIFDTAKSIAQVAGGIAVIEFLDLINVIKYWSCGDFIDDSVKGHFCDLLGQIAISAAIVASAAAWLVELGFGSLSELAASIGSIPIVGAVVQSIASVGLGTIACGAAAIAYFCWAGQDLQTIIQSEIKEEKIKAAISLASRVVHVALYVAILIPGFNIPAIIALGLVAKGLALASFLYGHYTKDIVKAEQAKIDERKKVEAKEFEEFKEFKKQKLIVQQLQQDEIGETKEADPVDFTAFLRHQLVIQQLKSLTLN